MKHPIIFLLLLFFVLIIGMVFVNPTFAQIAQKDVQALIQQLLEQVKSLQEQVSKLQAEVSSTKIELEAVKTELRFTKALRLGATGDEVKQLQEFLKQFPEIYPQGLVSGYFGPLTETAVRKFQEKQGIEAIGIVGPKTIAKLNELITEGAGASGVIPPGLLTAPGIQKKLEVSTTTPSVGITAPTPVQPVITAPTGVCLIKDKYTDIPPFSIANFGNGFAKYAVSGVNTAAGLKTACTKSIYDYLFQNYCKTTNSPAQRLVATYDNKGIGDANSLSCGLFGCAFIDCSSIASLVPIILPTTTPSGTVTATPAISATPTVTSATPAIPAQPVATATTTTETVTTLPIISNIQVSNITSTSATITWNTDKPATSQIYYGLTTSYGAVTNLNSTLTTSHSVNLTGAEIGGLTAATTYYFKALSKDSGGNLATSGGQSFTTSGTVSGGPGNSSLTATRLFPGQYDNIKYNLTLVDPEGISEFLISCAGGKICAHTGTSFIWGGSPKTGTPPCPTSITSGTVDFDPSDFPLEGWIVDCVNTNVKYTVQASMPPLPESTSNSLSFTPNSVDSGPGSWQTAKSTCSNLGARLPTVAELSILNQQKTTYGFREGYADYWTSQESGDSAYYVHFDSNNTNGFTSTIDKGFTFLYFRCVKDGTANTTPFSSILDLRAKNLAAILQITNSLNEILEKLSQFLK
ncbi:hypothetical protein A2833_00815 [Candidatus Azambacteria bacterium RIFCSPHIGHO2_01_FULL_44_55]|uniref:Fibronectin type-III domain-containing protein n=1 Tax=Candidatus Azambacteria bacterium RIFCSPLOWO2_02_FULL_44_14 TaxID=1797306 RepID=A0A1F5CAH9_9BACT|nr:MAG: hypothetical protein A3A18_00405 [Candidatus Azambacteria bacterium RIFCSPLOWO2_01_FULL_44_84]OGD32933.1 MAG: hypothetical protein A3C78_01240 [Candidatus Azambacteria bacterium RIFCSPHIGHO2_02_FULL_45_18]OGD39863.1 MAG: hypothetical protein A3I30_00450 [Candidatus Azambacteria bacterium RIFCSPLOWO2_02_FULL_44_14]OGD40853.1 MAG: hypothetical protein A2833_00815 [Candidatus Azambacteria bacterium RIFCSPHIGHO2_01_FULL_44_55]